MTDHSTDVEALRAQVPSDTVDLSDDEVRLHLAADLLELHDLTGISLDAWPAAREFVERAIGRPISENGA